MSKEEGGAANQSNNTKKKFCVTAGFDRAMIMCLVKHFIFEEKSNTFRPVFSQHLSFLCHAC